MRQAVGDYQIGDALDALAGVREGAGDTGDREGLVFDRGEDLPPGRALPGRTREDVSRRLEGGGQLEHLHDKRAERVGGGASFLDSTLSFR